MISISIPEIVDKYVINGANCYDINFNIVKEQDWYSYEQVKIPNGRFDYGGIVDTLVAYKYPNDKMQAVINNYLLDPYDSYAIDEFNKMQAWRKEAKEIAKEALLYELS